MTGKMHDERKAKIGFWFVFIGFNTVFIPQFIMGSRGMPRRYYDYLPQFEPFHKASTIGSWILGDGPLHHGVHAARGALEGQEGAAQPVGLGRLRVDDRHAAVPRELPLARRSSRAARTTTTSPRPRSSPPAGTRSRPATAHEEEGLTWRTSANRWQGRRTRSRRARASRLPAAPLRHAGAAVQRVEARDVGLHRDRDPHVRRSLLRLRHLSAAWSRDIFDEAHHFLNKIMGASNTVVLLFSSLTAALAVRSAQVGKRNLTSFYLVVTHPLRVRVPRHQVLRVQPQVPPGPLARALLRPPRPQRGHPERAGGGHLPARRTPTRRR